MIYLLLIIILLLVAWIIFAERRCKRTELALSNSLDSRAENAQQHLESLAIKDKTIKDLKAQVAALQTVPEESEPIHSVTWITKEGAEESQEFPNANEAVRHRNKLRKKRIKASYHALSSLAFLILCSSLVSCAKDVNGYWHYKGPRITGTVGFNGFSVGLTLAGEDVSKASVEVVKQLGKPVEVTANSGK